jgi:hypothetical protein
MKGHAVKTLLDGLGLPRASSSSTTEKLYAFGQSLKLLDLMEGSLGERQRAGCTDRGFEVQLVAPRQLRRCSRMCFWTKPSTERLGADVCGFFCG